MDDPYCRYSEYQARVSDTWSLGVILYVMLCGQAPFSNSLSPTTLDQMALTETNSGSHFQLTSGLWNQRSPACRDLISNLLHVNPRERFTTEQILAHPWIKQRHKLAGQVLITKVSPSKTDSNYENSTQTASSNNMDDSLDKDSKPRVSLNEPTFLGPVLESKLAIRRKSSGGQNLMSSQQPC